MGENKDKLCDTARAGKPQTSVTPCTTYYLIPFYHPVCLVGYPM